MKQFIVALIAAGTILYEVTAVRYVPKWKKQVIFLFYYPF